jgi:hypothetical protein
MLGTMTQMKFRNGNSNSSLFNQDEDGFFRIDGHVDVPKLKFISLVNALVDSPLSIVAAGRNGATAGESKLFWTYDSSQGLHVEAVGGFLDTKTGNGGFSLDVDRDGSWALRFDGAKKKIGYEADDDDAKPSSVPSPPAGNETVNLTTTGATFYDASRGHVTVNGGLGWDTIQGGVGDYMIGGSGTLGGGQAGRGNCAIYTKSAGPVLVDMEHGRGYGGKAEDNVLVNMNQVRGSLFSNVLIGAHTGSDLKSGGDNSLLISTGGNGFEMRPDGRGNVLVSTAGNDWIAFDPTKGWDLGDDNIMLGFDGRAGGDFLDLRLLTSATGKLHSDFHTAAAAGYDAATGHGDIDNYVKIVDAADGSHVMFNAYGNVAAAGVEILSLKFVHGLDAQSLFDRGGIRA